MNDLTNLEKLGHLFIFVAEAVLVIVVFWACDASLRPDAVAVLNDTNKSVTLRNCQYSLGTTNPVVIEAGETKSVNAINACQVHSPDYVGCLLFPHDAGAGASAATRVSRLNRHLMPFACTDTAAREAPRPMPGGN